MRILLCHTLFHGRATCIKTAKLSSTPRPREGGKTSLELKARSEPNRRTIVANVCRAVYESSASKLNPVPRLEVHGNQSYLQVGLELGLTHRSPVRRIRSVVVSLVFQVATSPMNLRVGIHEFKAGVAGAPLLLLSMHQPAHDIPTTSCEWGLRV